MMKTKILISLCACILLSGCGFWQKAVAHIEGYTTVCVKETGVMYVQFPTGTAPLYNKNGSLVTCE